MKPGKQKVGKAEKREYRLGDSLNDPMDRVFDSATEDPGTLRGTRIMYLTIIVLLIAFWHIACTTRLLACIYGPPRSL